MQSNYTFTRSAEVLRRNAEKILISGRHVKAAQITEAGGLRLIHELELHQIELEMQNEELIRINAEKDKFISILAHDLRGPFSSFLGLTKFFSEGLSEMKQEEAQELADSMKDSAASVYHLMENLLEWARMKRGLIEFKPVTVPLSGVIKRSADSLSGLARHKNQTVTIEIPEDILVNVDLTMLESTLRNLLSNAIKFSYRDGQIKISARVQHGTDVETIISDQGTGMSPALLETLFKIDSRSGRVGTEGELSTGLGLLLCREFIEKNGGKLSAQSIEGIGSTFRFTLPLAPRPFVSRFLI